MSNIYVIHPVLNKKDNYQEIAEYKLEEACSLVEALGDIKLSGARIVNTTTPRAATLIGSGIVEQMKEEIAITKTDVVFINHALSPIQSRNLEKEWKVKVIDRSGLILEIFANRAKTKEGKLQIELAMLEYQKGRLVKMWSHLERQRSGGSFTGGPGETQKELDKRLIEDRIVKLKKEISEVSRTRQIHRSSRKKVPYPVVAMVGYTNAGKSSLFNNLTNANVFAKDLLFATLDPTMRQMELPSNKKIILSDTVGFIADLPHQLIAAFKATLEEVLSADILLHVQDISHPKRKEQRAEVLKVLEELGIDNQTYTDKTIEIYNKADLLSAEEYDIELEKARESDIILTSAKNNMGIKELISAIENKTLESEQDFTIVIPFEDGIALSWVHEHTSVIDFKRDKESTIIKLKSNDKQAYNLVKMFGKYITKIN